MAKPPPFTGAVFCLLRALYRPRANHQKRRICILDIALELAREFGLEPRQTASVIELIDAGNTIPFIARYRKEATGALDDQLLRELGQALERLRALEKRRAEIERALDEAGALDGQMRQKLSAARTLSALEDLYLPYRPHRRTRASVARERGLEPLAGMIALGRADEAELRAAAERAARACGELRDDQAALAGARDILAERISEDAAARGALRAMLRKSARLTSRAAKAEDSVYRNYYAYAEPLSRMPSHRVLAVNRGEREGYLKVSVEADQAEALKELSARFVRGGAACARELSLCVADAYARLLFPALEREARAELTERAQDEAIRVFARNLGQLLMQRPVKGRVTLGVDPGFRTGCKLAVVDESGRVLECGVGYFTLPGQSAQREQAAKLIRGMITRHHVSAIAIGNGTASREAEAFIAPLLAGFPGVEYAIVSEAGASVYSASPLAAEEFPDYDLTLRSAISIARRLEDPLAELVKIEPRAIGVGQYQHDLKEAQLGAALSGVVEGCVNAVGVEVSTASAALLSYVAGIGPSLARNIVAYRDQHGISSRAQLKKVKGLGPRAFEQCAGFLRVAASPDALDNTGVHPESYPAARALLKRLGLKEEQVREGACAGIADRARLIGLDELATSLGVGRPTLEDILRELEKPGRDPRDALPPTPLRRDVLSMADLRPGMELEGTVRNVTDFGAFVDIGVHQDGLVHISRMSRRFIRHPGEAVGVGDVVRVWVLEVDPEKKRIALSMLPPEPGESAPVGRKD